MATAPRSAREVTDSTHPGREWGHGDTGPFPSSAPPPGKTRFLTACYNGALPEAVGVPLARRGGRACRGGSLDGWRWARAPYLLGMTGEFSRSVWPRPPTGPPERRAAAACLPPQNTSRRRALFLAIASEPENDESVKLVTDDRGGFVYCGDMVGGGRDLPPTTAADPAAVFFWGAARSRRQRPRARAWGDRRSSGAAANRAPAWRSLGCASAPR